MRKIIMTAGCILALSLFPVACRHNPVGVDAQPRVDFASQVLPIFQANCAKSGCHGGSSRSRLNLGTAAGILANVTPYDPLNSRLYSAITSSWSGIMPPAPSPPLPKELRTTIYLWILQGADTTSTGH